MGVRQGCNLAFRHNTVEIVAFLFQSSCVLRPVVKIQLAICVLRKILNLHLPAVFFIQRYSLNELIRCIPAVSNLLFQINLKLSRALAILVLIVIPYLSDDYPNYLRRIGVGYVVAPYTCCIICYYILSDRIINFCSVRILRQICECPLPVICCRNSLYLIGQRCAIRIQTDRDAARTLAILVIIIVPGLASADVDCRRDVHVGYVVTIHNSRVILYRILGDRVNDFFSFCILRQICEFPAPVVRCCYGLNLISQLSAIRIQMDRDAAWTLAILVVRIVPCLPSFDVDCLRSMRV